MSAGFRSIRPWTPLGWVPLALMLTACAGSPWGERLANSFPPAAETTPRPDAPAPAATPPGAATDAPSAASPAPRPTPNPSRPPAQPTKPASPPAASSAPTTAPSPVPYRVTLRLPRADPSAPAEAVTRALRAAGIAFEVETIERVPAGAAAPAVRPAPPPR